MILDPTALLEAKAISHKPEDVVVVQLGDLVDRGPNAILCMDIMLNVEAVIGWKTVVLFGNHEFLRMSMTDEYMDESNKLLVGLAGMKNAVIGRLGKVGLVMARLSLETDMDIDDPHNPNTLFVHGGINPDWLFDDISDSLELEQINREVRDELAVDEVEPGKFIFRSNVWTRWGLSGESPLWTRKFGDLGDSELCGDFLDRVLKHFRVARIVVGHIPQKSRTTLERCDGRILITDVQMSRYMDSHSDWEYHVDRVGLEGRPAAVIMTINEHTRRLESIVEHHWRLIDGTQESPVPIFPKQGLSDSDLADIAEAERSLAAVGVDFSGDGALMSDSEGGDDEDQDD